MIELACNMGDGLDGPWLARLLLERSIPGLLVLAGAVALVACFAYVTRR
jgi:hypothetical protein